jgi:uncharacterized membrane protein
MLAYPIVRSESGTTMQEAADRWHELTSWLSLQLDSLQAHRAEAIQELESYLWNFSVWLNSGYKGMTIALILLAAIVNSILKRR